MTETTIARSLKKSRSATFNNGKPEKQTTARLNASDGSINILIVDDEPKNLTVLETILNNPAYRLIKAESADQALLALLVDEFALLILDIRMPGVTGIELAKMIKERKKTSQIPIIFSPPTTTKTNTCWKAMAPELWISCTSLSTRTSCARRLLFLPSSIACNARSKSPT